MLESFAESRGREEKVDETDWDYRGFCEMHRIFG
jgi:hypothetical protein